MDRLVLIACLALCGCVSAPERQNPWDGLETARTSIVRPLSLPEQSSPVTIEVDGTEYSAFDSEGREALLALKATAEGNTEIAESHALALEDMGEAYNRLIRAGELEFELSETRRIMLEEERRARLFERWGNWAIMVILAIAAN